jgi:hypothetical protein
MSSVNVSSPSPFVSLLIDVGGATLVTNNHVMLLSRLPYQVLRVVAVCSYTLDSLLPLVHGVPSLFWNKISIHEYHS